MKAADKRIPPETAFRPEFVHAVKESEASYKAGRYTECRTEEEQDAYFERIWNEDE